MGSGPVLVLFVEHGFISVSAEFQPGSPRRGASHLVTYGVEFNLRCGFYHQFVVNVHGDKAVGQGLHGIAEDITGSGLNDIFHEFWAVGLQPLPFLCAADALVGDAFATELVSAEFRLYIGKLPARRKCDKEHPAPIGEPDATDLAVQMLLYGTHGSAVDVPPELHDVLVRVAPRSDQRLQFIFGKPHLQSAHCFERADRTAIANGEFSDFPFCRR